MSFILDALRKSENSRLRQEHPAMFDARAVAARRPFPVWAVALGLLLGLNLLVVLYVLLRDERATAAVTAPTSASVTAPDVAAPDTRPMPAAATPVVTTAAPATRATEVGTATRAVATPPAARTPESSKTPAPGTATVAAGEAAAASAAMPASRPSARTRDDLLARGDAVPEAALSLHVYDPDPAVRFILLNGQRLREGDMTGDGLRVLDIVPDGVVLDHRGNAFKVSIDP